MVREPLCLKEIDEAGAVKLLRKLAKDCGYEWIVFDVGQSFLSPEEILQYCFKVYMPFAGDRVSEEKMENFKGALLKRNAEGTDKWEQWERITLPFIEQGAFFTEDLEQLSWGKIGREAERMAAGLGCEQEEGSFKKQGA